MKVETLTIEQYMAIKLITDTYNKPETQSEYEKKIIEFFDGSLDVPIADGDQTILSLQKTLEEEIDTVTRFDIGGVEYGLIPNFEKMSTGEFIDLDTYLKEGTKLDRMMSILYRPITEKKGNLYQIEKYDGTDKYTEVMRKVDFKILKAVMVFFSRLENSLLNASHIYIKKQKNGKIILKQVEAIL
jgi:hypothetical protein